VNVFIEKLPSDIRWTTTSRRRSATAPKSLPSFVEIGRSVNTVNGRSSANSTTGRVRNSAAPSGGGPHQGAQRVRGDVHHRAHRFDAESVKVQPYLTSIEGV
jgi:hypothetical protein